MVSVLHHRVGLAILALSLTAAMPALAQNNGGAQQPPASPVNGAGNHSSPNQGSGDWDKEGFEQQNMREEMEQIRKEHEELEEARDRLMDKCINVTPEQAAQCKQERDILRERNEKLHERMQALREKMEEHRKEREARREEHGGPQGGPPNSQQNSGHRPPPPPSSSTPIGSSPNGAPPAQ